MSCIGNTNVTGQVDSYVSQDNKAESVGTLLYGLGNRLNIKDSTLIKSGATSIAPWFNDWGYNAAMTAVSISP